MMWDMCFKGSKPSVQKTFSAVSCNPSGSRSKGDQMRDVARRQIIQIVIEHIRHRISF